MVAQRDETRVAYLAGGCFWGMEELFRALDGVISTQVGYMGGSNAGPTYENHPGHAEALQITYDPSQTSYKELLDFFFRIHDPTTRNKQGNDIGASYRSAIFYRSADERREAESFIAIVNNSGRWQSPVVTTLERFKGFYPAEAEHQKYLQRYPDGYTCHYVRFGKYEGQ